MATKYGQDAIDAWARLTAKRRTQLKTIIVLGLFGIGYMTFAHVAATGDKSSLVGLGVFLAVVGFFALKIRSGATK